MQIVEQDNNCSDLGSDNKVSLNWVWNNTVTADERTDTIYVTKSNQWEEM